MPRTDEAEHWFNAVYSAVQEIPPGKVTSYGHIALLLGYRRFTFLYFFYGHIEISLRYKDDTKDM